MTGRGTRVRKRKGNLNGFEEWGGYMNAKKEKLEKQFDSDQVKEAATAAAAADGKGGIFEGVSIFVNGYTDPSADELKRIMMLNGGTFHHYISKKTTHVIANNLPDAKVKRLIGNEPICHPRWVVPRTGRTRKGKLILSNLNSRQNNFVGGFRRASPPAGCWTSALFSSTGPSPTPNPRSDSTRGLGRPGPPGPMGPSGPLEHLGPLRTRPRTPMTAAFSASFTTTRGCTTYPRWAPTSRSTWPD